MYVPDPFAAVSVVDDVISSPAPRSIEQKRHEPTARLQQKPTNKKHVWPANKIQAMLLCSFVPLALSLALLTLIFWTCYQYPYRFLHGDRNFLERWSFIFDRFHPKTYYFALILKLGSEKTITSGGICLCKKIDGEGFWF